MSRFITYIFIFTLLLYFCALEFAGAETPVYTKEGLQVKRKAELPGAKSEGLLMARPGDIITYTITCSNNGNIDYTNVKIEDTLSKELEFLDFIGKGSKYQKEYHKITFDIGRLRAGGEPQEFKYRTKIITDIDTTRIHRVRNIAVVTSDQGDLPPVAEIVYAIPDFLKLSLTCDKSFMEIGSPMTYVIDIENISVDTTIRDVTIVDALPPSVNYIKGTSRIDGEKVADPKIEMVYDAKIAESRQELSWGKIITLEPKARSKLAFRAVLAPPISDKASEPNTCRAYGNLEMKLIAVSKRVPKITPTIEQPRRFAVKERIPPLPLERLTPAEKGPRKVPGITSDAEQPIDITPLPGMTAFSIVVTNPVQPPNVRIEFQPNRIPAGDLKIIVTSPDLLLNVVAEHPDGRRVQLQKNANGDWQAKTIVPGGAADGPYPFTFRVADETGREWYFSKTVMVDSSIGGTNNSIRTYLSNFQK